jgi:hypothetical protein
MDEKGWISPWAHSLVDMETGEYFGPESPPPRRYMKQVWPSEPKPMTAQQLVVYGICVAMVLLSPWAWLAMFGLFLLWVAIVI